MNMDFKEILERYENDIDYANRMLEPNSLSFFKKTKDFWTGYKKASYKWFQFMKIELQFTPETEKMTEEESKDLIYYDEFDNYYYPWGWLLYRGERIPMYTDDYGQQNFIVYRGKGFYGGNFNFHDLEDFCSYIDTVKDGIE